MPTPPSGPPSWPPLFPKKLKTGGLAGASGVRVSVALEAESNLADLAKQAASLNAAMEGVQQQIGQVNQSIGGMTQQAAGFEHTLDMVARFAGFGTVAIGLEFLTRKFFGVRDAAHAVLEEWEVLRLANTSVLVSTGAGSFAQSGALAEGMQKELHAYSLKHQGTSAQYQQVAADMLEPVRRFAGGTSATVVDLAKKLVPLYATLTPGREGQVGSDIAQMVSLGGISDRPGVLNDILHRMGMIAPQLNSLQPNQRVEVILKGVGLFGDVVGAGDSTARNQNQKLAENLSDLGLKTFNASFEETGRIVQSLNALLNDNRETVDGIAKAVGDGFLASIKSVLETVKTLLPLMKELALIGGAILAVKGIMSLVAASNALVAAGGTFLGASLPAIPLIGMGGATVGGTGILAAAGGLVATILPIILIGATIALIVGAVSSFMISRSVSAHEAELKSEGDASMFGAIGRMEAKAHEFGFADPMGAIRAANKVGTLHQLLDKSPVLAKYAGVVGLASSQGTLEREPLLASKYGVTLADGLMLKKSLDEKAHPPLVYMNVRIEQTFRENQDPDRIATITAKRLKELALHGTTQRHTLAGSGYSG